MLNLGGLWCVHLYNFEFIVNRIAYLSRLKGHHYTVLKKVFGNYWIVSDQWSQKVSENVYTLFSIALQWRHESWHWSKEFRNSVYSVMNAMIMFDWVLMWFERKDELNTGKRKCNILGLFHIILSFVRSNILCIQCRRNWDTTGRYSERFSSLLFSHHKNEVEKVTKSKNRDVFLFVWFTHNRFVLTFKGLYCHNIHIVMHSWLYIVKHRFILYSIKHTTNYSKNQKKSLHVSHFVITR